MKKITIVVPVYNEEENIIPFYDEVSRVVAGCPFSFELLYVNDGSTDNTLSVIKELQKHAKNVTVAFLSYSPNKGKEEAIYVGLDKAVGDYIILMDGDLEHPPSLIPKMLALMETEDLGAVGAKRNTRFISNLFTLCFNLITPIHLEYGATDFMCMTPDFVQKVVNTKVKYRFTKGLFASTGLPVCWLTYIQKSREHGKGKWNFGKLFIYGTHGIIAFSDKAFR